MTALVFGVWIALVARLGRAAAEDATVALVPVAVARWRL